jgi:pimeloyl-ACP methyl ester carboxylesterase
MWLGAVGKRKTLTFSQFAEELPHRRGRRWTRRIFLDSLRHLRARYEPVQRALCAVTCPSVVVWGDRDPFFPVSVGERTARSIPGARFETLQGCGHFVPGEAPAELAAIIRRQLGAATRK